MTVPKLIYLAGLITKYNLQLARVYKVQTCSQRFLLKKKKTITRYSNRAGIVTMGPHPI